MHLFLLKILYNSIFKLNNNSVEKYFPLKILYVNVWKWIFITKDLQLNQKHEK